MTPRHPFLDELHDRGFEPLLAKTTGCLRVELTGGNGTDRFYVNINKGELTVTQKGPAAPTCIIRSTRELFDQIARGEQNAMAAALRGSVHLEGDPGILLVFQRLLPGPPTSSHPRAQKRTTR